MRVKYLFLSVVFALILTPINNVSASTQDFYFEDFTADYYLTKLEDGTSNLHVKEVLTAVFPYTNQNHGITRSIPFTKQGGRNRTIANQDALNLKVLRNGEPENINSIEVEDDYFVVYIGDADEYVHGEQVYTLEYDYTDVITEFDADGYNVSGEKDAMKMFQELYWDTNGTAWQQEFGSLTANLHMSEEIYQKVKADDTKCYVGSYGKDDEDRCFITTTEDGYSFTTYDLDVEENLTFAVDFRPGTFEVVLEDSYVLVVVLVIEITIASAIIAWRYLRWKKTAKAQQNLYKDTFVAPQYQPPVDKKIGVAEGEQVYLKKTKSSYVATLLELAVSKKVTIKKVEGEKRYDWSVILNVEPGDLTGSQKEMMNILSGNGGLAKGDEIPIEKHKATNYLASCARDYRTKAEKVLENGGYLVEEEVKKQLNSMQFAGKFILWVWAIMMFFSFADIIFEWLIPSGNAIVVGVEYLPEIILVILIVAIITNAILKKWTRTYAKYTEEGIRLVRYLEGLELYIKMAEADRLRFLQSVEGVDTSNKGIVKLYEKLLPWASLFGAEKSWVKELSKYYEIEDVDGIMNTDVLNGIIAADMIHSVNSTISSSTRYAESSGGGGSSWSSGGGGGGGGGFSGGGGGGGGGGGW